LIELGEEWVQNCDKETGRIGKTGGKRRKGNEKERINC